MKFEELVMMVGDEPVFASSLLLAGRGGPLQTRLQLSRWVNSGRVIQLRRGLYALGQPWRKVEPHPFLVANRVRRGSYVSLQSALAWHGLIPEHAPVVTSVGPGRPGKTTTPLGTYRFFHIAEELRFGYSEIEVTHRQSAFVASPEKALLDLVYLTPGSDSGNFLRELRLQNHGVFHPTTLEALAVRSGKPKLLRATKILLQILEEEEDFPL